MRRAEAPSGWGAGGRRRPAGLILLWLAALLAALPAAAAPVRVVSINLCADQLLLLLARPEQILAVSHLALDPEHSYFASRAAAYPTNYARIEELIALKPDLVLGSRYTDPALSAALKRVGIALERLEPATDLAQILRNVRRTGALLGRPEAAERALAPLLALQAGEGPIAPGAPAALLLQPNGYTAGKDTLQHTAMRLAGWRNLAAEQGFRGFRPLGLEQLLALPPARLLHSSFHPGAASRARGFLDHPAIARKVEGSAPVEVPYRYWICGGPMLAQAVARLREARP